MTSQPHSKQSLYGIQYRGYLAWHLSLLGSAYVSPLCPDLPLCISHTYACLCNVTHYITWHMVVVRDTGLSLFWESIFSVINVLFCLHVISALLYVCTICTFHTEVVRLQKKHDELVIPREEEIASYYKLRQQLDRLGREMQTFIVSPKYCVPFLQPGRMVKVSWLHYFY